MKLKTVLEARYAGKEQEILFIPGLAGMDEDEDEDYWDYFRLTVDELIAGLNEFLGDLKSDDHIAHEAPEFHRDEITQKTIDHANEQFEDKVNPYGSEDEHADSVNIIWHELVELLRQQYVLDS